MESNVGANVSSIKKGSTTVAKTNNWTYSNGKLTIKKEYLATLTNGKQVLTLVMSQGDNITVEITVATTE